MRSKNFSQVTSTRPKRRDIKTKVPQKDMQSNDMKTCVVECQLKNVKQDVPILKYSQKISNCGTPNNNSAKISSLAEHKWTGKLRSSEQTSSTSIPTWKPYWNQPLCLSLAFCLYRKESKIFHSICLRSLQFMLTWSLLPSPFCHCSKSRRNLPTFPLRVWDKKMRKTLEPWHFWHRLDHRAHRIHRRF